MQNTFRQIGSTLGVAVLGTIVRGNSSGFTAGPQEGMTAIGAFLAVCALISFLLILDSPGRAHAEPEPPPAQGIPNAVHPLLHRVLKPRLGRSPSTASREMARNGGRDRYWAASADAAAYERGRRPKLAKLAQRPALRALVEAKLALCWPLEQGAA
ncbi:hypothetical protein ACWD5R_32190 [Streptomyces sp. NPDC002514]|uniref:hypothetical protein n=1 Tax=Streptomyces sp. NPDC001270 TaxID=3364554 RepID=UPI00369D1297